jgi:hypothetical protein
LCTLARLGQSEQTQLIMTEQANIVDVDPETLALLRETGIDPQA